MGTKMSSIGTNDQNALSELTSGPSHDAMDCKQVDNRQERQIDFRAVTIDYLENQMIY